MQCRKRKLWMPSKRGSRRKEDAGSLGRREMAKAKFQKEETLAETEEVLKREREMRDQFSWLLS